MYAILCMSAFSFLLVLAGSLELILEFGSVTFLLVSLLMAYANFKIRDVTKSSLFLTVLVFLGLTCGMVSITYYEWRNQPQQLIFIAGLYGVLTISSWGYSKVRTSQERYSQGNSTK